jgi:hypothetical protein
MSYHMTVGARVRTYTAKAIVVANRAWVEGLKRMPLSLFNIAK